MGLRPLEVSTTSQSSAPPTMASATVLGEVVPVAADAPLLDLRPLLDGAGAAAGAEAAAAAILSGETTETIWS